MNEKQHSISAMPGSRGWYELKRAVVFFLFTGCLFSSLLVPQHKVAFERISLEAGLSQSAVFCILQDRKGFLWVGTEDGLNRYDGYEFKIFRHDPDNPGSLSNNQVRALYEDSSGILWVGTRGGLNRFDRETETFTCYRKSTDKNTHPDNSHFLGGNLIRTILEDSTGVLWVGTEDGGVSCLTDRLKMKFTHYKEGSKAPPRPG